MAKKKSQPQKIATIKLTDHEREVLAEGVNGEFFKIIQDKILPQRRIQLAMTAIEADQTMEDIWYHRGMIYMCSWLPKWMKGETEKVDTAIYDESDEASAEDDNSVS